MIATEIRLKTSRSIIDIFAMEKWCTENIGPHTMFRDNVGEEFKWSAAEQFGYYIFYFADIHDATMFKLVFNCYD